MIGLARKKRPRVAKKSLMLAYPATHRDGSIARGRGAWVKAVGEDERRFDKSLRLTCNIGDRLIVTWGDCWRDVAAVEVKSVSGGWNETWSVKLLAGSAPANGDVMLQPAGRAGR